MATESIGTVRVDIIGNAEDLKVEVQRAKNLVSSMGPEFEKSYNKMSAAQKRATVAALQFEKGIGKSREEVRLLSLAARGAAPEALERVRQKLLQTRDAGAGMARTSKEMQFAMRGLPAQMTDIFTSLAAGQNPMMVFLQQGGQMKDMFGGIRPAAAALGGAIAGLVTPFTVTAAAAAALGTAIYQGSQEFNAYNRALAKTGDFLGLTAAELGEFAAELDNLNGVTERAASGAIAKVAESGKLAGDNFRLATQAALVWSEATGDSVDSVIDKFVEIGKKPVEALLKLNETEHFLTQTQLDRIRALEEEGRAQEAVAEAARLYSDVVIERAGQVEANLGYLEQAWRGISETAAEAWDAMLGLGRVQTRTPDDIRAEIEKVAGLTFDAWREEQLKFRQQSLDPKEMMLLPDIDEAAFRKAIKQRMDTLRNELANSDGFIRFYDGSEPVLRTDEENARAALREKWAADDLKHLSDAERMQRELNAAEAEGIRLGLKRAEIDKQLADIRAEYAEKAGTDAGTRAVRLTEEEKAARALAQSFESVNASLTRQIVLFGQSGEAARVAYEIQHGSLRGLSADLQAVLMEQAGWADWQREMADVFGIIEQTSGEHFRKMAKDAGESYGQMSEFAKEAGRNMQDAFADFLFDPFKEGLDGLGKAFAELLQRMAAEAAASAIFDSLGEWGNANAGEGNFWANLASSFFGGATANAKGGVYDSPSLSAYSGGVYNSPQLFAFAKGAGVFGEAGPEAIMPLSRGPDGKLGVTAEGFGAPVFNMEFHGAPSQPEVTSQRNSSGGFDVKVFWRQVKGEVRKGIAQGEFDGVAGQAWGVRRVGHTRG